ncbi:amidohydrolase family protein [Streptomyces sp. NPDC005480]|uniref:amidohydrolase family protein n=1 Tax=Streptomyces sp. NPDC005480 TaxID=3154880 RepID=UPI0033A5C664
MKRAKRVILYLVTVAVRAGVRGANTPWTAGGYARTSTCAYPTARPSASRSLVESGMTPMGAILAGTSEAAELLGLAHEVGTLEPGKRADLVIARGDPLTDVASLGKPENVLLVAEDGVPCKDTDGLAA